VRLEQQPALEAVRILVATLEAADWTVEPATIYDDELRVRYQGRNRCPSMYAAPPEGRQYGTRWRGHSDEPGEGGRPGHAKARRHVRRIPSDQGSRPASRPPPSPS
jgi:hypothetical protein